MGVHPVARLGHEPLCAIAEQQVDQQRERRDQGRRCDERQRGDLPEVVLLEVDADRQKTMTSLGNNKISRSPVLSAVFQSALCSVPNYLGGSIVSRFT